MSNAHRVAEIPELIISIAGFLNSSGLVPMMRVSQHFFRIAGPWIWREVPNIEILMRLIPGATQSHIEQRRGDSYCSIKQVVSQSIVGTR